jgi:hypothetical protein
VYALLILVEILLAFQNKIKINLMEVVNPYTPPRVSDSFLEI